MSAETSPAGEADSSSDADDKDPSVDCPACGERFPHNSYLTNHLKDCDPSRLAECPTCGDLFRSGKGVKMHHARTHGESIAQTEITCDYCGETKQIPDAWVRRREGDGKYCSKECRAHDEREERETRTCELDSCSETFTARVGSSKTYHRVECAYEDRDGFTMECPICGVEFSLSGPKRAERRATCGADECRSEWLSENYSGENNGAWKGGYRDYYGPSWNRQKRKALERDNRECQACGATKDEIGQLPSVHHIVPFRKFGVKEHEEANRLDNLVCLCPSCHSDYEGLYIRPDTR